MGLPEINITFAEAGAHSVEANERGVAAMILLEGEGTEAQICAIASAKEMPEGLSAENQEAVKRLFMGSDNGPKKLILYVGADLTAGLQAMKAMNFDWLAGPAGCTAEQAGEIAQWIKACWEDKDYKRAVLPNQEGNFEGIVNLQEDEIIAGGKTYTAAAYCSRIVGMICGLEAERSLTYYPLEEVESVSQKTRAAMDQAIDGGKLVLWHDGEKVKIGRGVTSYTGKEGYKKKIRLVDIICRIKTDLTREIEDGYIGRFSNTYQNKLALTTAILGYFSQLEQAGLISNSDCQIDLEKQRAYLASKGIDVSEMTEDDLIQQNTDSKVFLKCAVGLQDTLEDVYIEIAI